MSELLQFLLQLAALISPAAIGGAIAWYYRRKDARRERDEEASEEAEKARIEDARNRREELWEQYEKAYNRSLALQDTNMALALKYSDLLKDRGILEAEKANLKRQLDEKQAGYDALLQKYSTLALQENENNYYMEQERKCDKDRIAELSTMLEAEKNKYDELLKRIIRLELKESE